MYYLFAGSPYYNPQRGSSEYVGEFPTVSEACVAAGNPGGAFSWYEVLKATPTGLERVLRRGVYFDENTRAVWTDI